MTEPSPDISSPDPIATPDAIAQLRAQWRGLWQVPAMLASAGLLVGGLMYTLATKPDPDFRPTFESAAQLIQREQYRDALDLLNSQILPYLGRPELSNRDTAEFRRLIAQAVYEGQRAIGVEHERNYQNAVAALREAEGLGVELTPREHFILADSYLKLGELDASLARAEQIKGEDELARRIKKAVVARYLRATPPRLTDAEVLLTRMASDPVMPLDEQAWVVDQQAQLDLDAGHREGAITRLLRSMPRLQSASPLPRARLHLVLARAYLEADATEEAAAQIATAADLIPSGDTLEAESHLLHARVQEQRGEYEQARDTYLSVIAHFQPPRLRVRAEHGAAVMDAWLGNHASAQQLFGSLVSQVRANEPEAIEVREQLAQSLLQTFRDQLLQHGVDISFRYAEIAGELYPVEELPEPVYEALGTAHRLMADRIEETAVKIDGPLGPELDPSTEREVQRLRIRSATFYRLHAMKFVVTDLARYADSLWQSATLYDKAGDQDEAVATFARFVEDLPSDPRQPEARYKLAQAYSSRGQYDKAAEMYRAIINDRDRGSTQSGVGRFADLSHVPLAQVYLLDGDPANDDAAEILLSRVIDGTLGGPDSVYYMPALVALADLHHRRQEYGRAIERFEEVLERGGPESQGSLILFKLAESYRLNARAIDASLAGSLTEGDRRILAETRLEHLTRSLDLYEQARARLESIQPHKRSPLENLALRNAYFYLGDCAFDLGQLDLAVRHYNAARERYTSDPASLVALVQIVNAYVQTGNLTSARSANERARLFYQSLPPEVWDDPNLPMTRRDWERWLASSSRLYAGGDTNP